MSRCFQILGRFHIDFEFLFVRAIWMTVLTWYAKLDNLEYNIENERRPLMNHAKHVIPMSDTSVSIKPEDIQPTVLPDAFIQSDMVRKLNALSRHAMISCPT